MRRRLATGILALPLAFRALGVQPAPPSNSEQKGGGRAEVVCNANGCRAGVSDGGSGGPAGQSGQPTRSSGSTVACKYGLLGPGIDPSGYPDARDATRDIQDVVVELTEDWWYVTNCDNGGRRVFQHQVGEPAVSPQFLARQAYDTLTIAVPEPSTSPSVEHDHLVGLATWMWIDPHGFEPVTASASIPGLSVTVTATPTRVVWDMADGSDPIACDDPGTPYDTDERPEFQETDCSHVYQWHGDYSATATTTWDVAWSASNGTGGTFPTIDRTTGFDLHVVERQAVILTDP